MREITLKQVGFWLILLVAGLIGASGVALAISEFKGGDQTDQVFDQSYVHEISINIDATAWEGMRRTTRAFRRVPQRASIIYDGQPLDEIGVATAFIREHAPAFYLYPSLRLDFGQFRPGQRLLGVQGMDLKGLGSDDNSLIVERLAFELNAAFGTLSSRTAYARLTVNDEYIGAYLVVESIPDVVTRRFANNQGNLYLLKNTSQSPNGLDAFALASKNPTDPRSYIGDVRREHLPFEMPFGRFDGRDIVDLIQAFNQATPGATRLAVSALLNLDTLIDYLAVDMALTNTDGLLAYDDNSKLSPGQRVYYNKNTFFYHDPTTNQFFVMPYNLKDALDAFYPDSFTRDLRDGWDRMRITRLLLDDASLMNQYFNRVRAFVNQFYDPDFIIQGINDLADQIRPAVVEDLSRTTTPPRTLTVDEWENRVDQLRQYIRKRAANLRQQISRL